MTPAPPTSDPTNPTGRRTAATHPCPFAGHTCVGACAPGTLLSSGCRKARKHLGTYLCAIRKQQVLSGDGQVPVDLVPAVHAAAFVPALSRFCELCCMLRSPMRVPRNHLAAVQPSPNRRELTPCGRRAGGTPARCAPAPAPAAAASAEPPRAPAPAPRCHMYSSICLARPFESCFRASCAPRSSGRTCQKSSARVWRACSVRCYPR
jgi:hypothetical protein